MTEGWYVIKFNGYWTCGYTDGSSYWRIDGTWINSERIRIEEIKAKIKLPDENE